MIIETKYFGELEIDEKSILTFPFGILGFETFSKYAFFNMPQNDKFYCLQSLEENEVAFLLIKPWDFFHDYETDISQEELDAIHINEMEQMVVFNIITIPEQATYSTANLLAPVIINVETKEGMQIVLKEGKYQTKHRLWQYAEAAGEAKC